VNRMATTALPELPTTIDQVIFRLNEIIEAAIEAQSRLGYFAALYNRVTMAVRDGIGAGAFEDNQRMERLDVAFANRYLDAFDRYSRGETPTASWKIAFEAAPHDQLSVLQHLFLGMNAHIHLDLGIASTETAAEASIESIERDFHHINDVLASIVPIVEEELGEITHRFSTLSHISHGLDQKVVNFSMAQAREDAWHFAVRLSQVADPQRRAALIAERDKGTVKLGRLFRHAGTLTRIAGHDQTDVAQHIRVLARGEYGIA